MRNNSSLKGPIAVKNVALFMAMAMRLVDRAEQLPGLAVCSGPSGYGKTWASIYAQNKTRAIRVEVGDTWTRRTLLQNILREFSVEFRLKATLSDLAAQAIAALGDDPRRPLIIDEADRLVDNGYIEIVRELLDSSGAPVILIGEEKLPTKLLNVERVHNRVLDWFQAQPLDMEDARAITKATLPNITVKDDLLAAICSRSDGRARRVAVNLEKVRELARNLNVSTVDLKAWGNTEFHSGKPPAARNIPSYHKPEAA